MLKQGQREDSRSPISKAINLQKQLERTLKAKNRLKAVEIYAELGELYRRAGSFESSIEFYQQAAILAERLNCHEDLAYACRAIAEISVDPKILNNEKAIQYGLKYFDAAKKSGQVHLIQLAYHVIGWLHLQVYLNSDTKEDSFLTKGKNWCEKGLTYLVEKACLIDADKNAVKIGQDSRSRKARLRQLLSQICDKLNLQHQSIQHHNAAIAYASKILKEKIRAKDFNGAKWDFISMLSSKFFDKLDDDERNSFEQSMIFVYKTVERLNVINERSEYEKMKTYEKMADEFFETEFKEVSLHFYKLMLEHADNNSDRIKALVSLAETASELEKYQQAYEYYLEVEKLESEEDIGPNKRAETAICIANAACNVDSLSHSVKIRLFHIAETAAVTNRQKIDLLVSFSNYLKSSGDSEDLLAELQSKLKCAKQHPSTESSSDDSMHDADNFSDKWDEMSDVEIINLCHLEASHHCIMERLKCEKNKKINSYGETRMHEAARGGDTNLLRTMIELGYDLNPRDEGGWTPLHEAVGALQVENVHILLESGARVDIRSNEGTLSEDGELMVYSILFLILYEDGELMNNGGLTPLMEACDRGCIAIVDILLHYNADVTLKSRDGWLASDFLKNSINSGMIDDDDIQKANKLVELMESKLKKGNKFKFYGSNIISKDSSPVFCTELGRGSSFNSLSEISSTNLSTNVSHEGTLSYKTEFDQHSGAATVYSSPTRSRFSNEFRVQASSQFCTEKTQLIFLKVHFQVMNGVDISCLVKEIRLRCLEELKNDGEFDSLSIILDGCEIMDDVPISLLINNVNSNLNAAIICRINDGMENVIEALKAGKDGILNFCDMNIGSDSALCDAFQLFPDDQITELNLSGNSLNVRFLEILAKKCQHIIDLDLSCCNLTGRNMRFLVDERVKYEKLKKLNFSFNDIGNFLYNNYLSQFLFACPQLVNLFLIGCNISYQAFGELLQVFKGMEFLEVLDLSQNECITSEHASEIVNSCKRLKHLYLNATSVSQIKLKLEFPQLWSHNNTRSQYTLLVLRQTLYTFTIAAFINYYDTKSSH
ncbi:unnamed protein product [Dracunculus medinensis]|uniref:ANK_REP_REGION domain-containing protein n=1 Tax=Dracunculus medinensis TaxID=318479 RepID=A0A0N4UCX0_DRAME|nr:unnamed protein product [Dracunculus medinensis]